MANLRARNRDEQSERILSAAFGLFFDQGFEEVTMADVAETAGVSRATVFNHFRSKQGLVDAITEQVLLSYRDMLDAALAHDEHLGLVQRPLVPRQVLKVVVDDACRVINRTQNLGRNGQGIAIEVKPCEVAQLEQLVRDVL